MSRQCRQPVDQRVFEAPPALELLYLGTAIGMTSQEFAQQDPELAASGQERLDRNGLVMLATLSKNGWPRISPVGPLFFNGLLYLAMM